MIKVAIVEDDAASRRVLAAHLARYQQEQEIEFGIAAFSDGRSFIDRYRLDFDIVLLDIQMEPLDGMTVAQMVRRTDPDVVIVFVTSSPHHAINGYRVGALSYLLKPISYAALAGELDRSIRHLAKTERRHLLVGSGDEFHNVDCAEIVFIESNKHRITVHALDQDYLTTGPLRRFEQQLEAGGFCRINNCYLVNLRHVTAIKGSDCLTRGGHVLKISRARKKGLLDALTDYIGEAGHHQ
ncbi:MAG: LytTR family DNA-binding domain-containing protein [Bifidobacteriaceae bacterium]|nr:LytTR family DNA-binding domain-containing protein [Bifidobacteriaceae bacterium]